MKIQQGRPSSQSWIEVVQRHYGEPGRDTDKGAEGNPLTQEEQGKGSGRKRAREEKWCN